MIAFPNCKINLGLHITSKRSDGFHNIETVFYPVNWCDILEVIENKNYRVGDEKVFFKNSGLVIDGDVKNNLCIRAYDLLDTMFNLPPVFLRLHKIIPFGAGLGGGSSDAAFTLKLLNEKFNLNSSVDDLKKYASQLGSDCSFFISNKPSLATGKGELLSEINLSLKGKYIAIVKPTFSISTKEAYSLVKPSEPKFNLQAFASLPMEEWKNNFVNDFEKPLFEKYSQLKELKKLLYDNGAFYASMSGSGSAMFGLFNQKPHLEIPFLTEAVFISELN
jgi:4-diphosphocytidyl-2-C-methyl-D-erythritol kinase